jgi:hypothetical protein
MKMKQILTVVCSLLVLMALVACGGGGSATPQTVTSDALGVTMEIPSDWAFVEEAGELTIANTTANLTADDITSGAGAIMNKQNLSDMGVDNVGAAIEMFSTVMGEGSEVVKPAETVTINGLTVGRITLKGEIEGQTGTYTVALIDNPANQGNVIFAMFVDASTDGQYASQLDGILNSMKAK